MSPRRILFLLKACIQIVDLYYFCVYHTCSFTNFQSLEGSKLISINPVTGSLSVTCKTIVVGTRTDYVREHEHLNRDFFK